MFEDYPVNCRLPIFVSCFSFRLFYNDLYQYFFPSVSSESQVEYG